eukprot:gene9799-7688_t
MDNRGNDIMCDYYSTVADIKSQCEGDSSCLAFNWFVNNGRPFGCQKRVNGPLLPTGEWDMCFYKKQAPPPKINIMMVKAHFAPSASVGVVTYRQVEKSKWVEEAAGATSSVQFTEYHRDQWSVYLLSQGAASPRRVQIEMWKKQVIENGLLLANVLDASSGPCTADGTFEPDPAQYYLIGTGTGLFWAAAGGDMEDQELRLTSDSLDSSSHWRFKPSNSVHGPWQIVNRKSGQIVQSKKTDQVHYRLVAGVQATSDRSMLDVDGMCKDNGVLFTAAFKDGWIRPSNTIAVGQTLQVASDGYSQNIVYVRCGWGCPAGYYVTNSTDYFFCKSYRCVSKTHIIPPPAAQAEKLYWGVTPVGVFRKPDVAQAPVVKILGSPEAEIANGLAKSASGRSTDLITGILGASAEGKSKSMGLVEVFGTVAGHPFFAAGAPLLNFIIDNLFPGPPEIPIDDKLADLTRQLMEVMDSKISVSLAENREWDAGSILGTLRESFLLTYAGEKSTDVLLCGSRPEKMESLASELQGYGEGYKTQLDILSASEEDYKVSPVNVQRAQVSWDLAKLASMELGMIMEERVALDAFIAFTELELNPNVNAKSCDTIITRSIDVPRIVDEVKNQLVLTQRMLIQSRVGQEKGSDRVANAKKEELKFDMEHLSYDLRDELLALGSLETRIEEICNKIRNGSDGTFRAAWIGA